MSIDDKIPRPEPGQNRTISRPGSTETIRVSGWTGLHSWIFLLIVVLGVLVITVQNRYHFLSPLGLGKAYRIDKLFGGIQEFDPNKGWVTAQLQIAQSQMSMPEPQQGSRPVPMSGMAPTEPSESMPQQARTPKEEPKVEKPAPPPPSVRTTTPKPAEEMSPEERYKAFQKVFPGFGKEEFQLANDDLYPDWKDNHSTNGTWPEFLKVYKDFIQWWSDMGSPQDESGTKLWNDYLAAKKL